MKTAILGTGMVGQALAGKLLELGHEVTMGTRKVEETTAKTEPHYMTGVSFADWYQAHQAIKLVDFDKMGGDFDLFVNATGGSGSIAALKAVGNQHLKGKILLDVANPLDFSKGMPPSLTVCNDDSLGEQIQREFPDLKVVKGLNTMNAFVMVEPSRVPGDHNVFLSGNDAAAKETVMALLTSFGWPRQNFIDLGDISTARGSEMILAMWVRLWGALQIPDFNFHIARK